MTYSILASYSCLLTDVVDLLHESSKKLNALERLTRYLGKGVPGIKRTCHLYNNIVKPDS
ncbi:hypothetical protein NSB25_09560 [Acetatifactor muris]|uniref:hypothetical protein n=1 Tax=Acetatifactor muris TaxID=879566 RepID=UPI000CD31F0B|nr:hypothetical protein [Acetatifactor muris]MCR2047526.1 hypothetical protein [Acetatifactor muris]